MKILVLFSRHEAGNKEKAEAISAQLGGRAQVVGVEDAYDAGLGQAVQLLLGARAFPCIVPVLDHLSGAALDDPMYVKGLLKEMQDIEDREVHKMVPNHLANL